MFEKKLGRNVLETLLNMLVNRKLDPKINRMGELCTVHTPVFAHTHKIDLCNVSLTRKSNKQRENKLEAVSLEHF